MRVGQNPNKPSYAPAEFSSVCLAVITHLPNLTTAYHWGRIEVVKTCLRSMRAGANHDHTFMVWDNGSIPELRNWLQDEFKPDVLILSVNVGKGAARTALGRMVPPRSILAYSDDDMLFYDNWLEPQIELLNHFPNVACVSGYPCRTAFRWGIENTIAWARENAKLETGIFLPQQWEDDFAFSVGRTPQWHREYTLDDMDYRVTYNGRQAYCTAHHCQFIARAETVGRILQYDHLAMGDEKPFDITMDKIGLRLSTTQRLARHIGNVLDDEIKKEIMQLA